MSASEPKPPASAAPVLAHAPASLRRAEERDVPILQRLIVAAFSAHMGLSIESDASFAQRYYARNCKVWVAESGSEVLGCMFLTYWGSFAFFGPLCIDPAAWGRGIAQQLIKVTLDDCASNSVRHLAIYTFAASTKHLHLYTKYNLMPRFLTMQGVKKITAAPPTPTFHYLMYSRLSDEERKRTLTDVRALLNDIHPGLDSTAEFDHVIGKGFGEVLLVLKHNSLASFAVCHYGPQSEGGSAQAFIKFGAARHGHGAAEAFKDLLSAVEVWAYWCGAPAILGGFNYAREEAMAIGQEFGFRPVAMGVMLHLNNDPFYARPGVYVIEDLR